MTSEGLVGSASYPSESPLLVIEPPAQIAIEKDDYQHRFLGVVQVKGKDVPVKVFEVFGADPEPVRDKKAETNKGFQEGLDLYFEKRFAEAAMKFNAALEVSPDDKAFQLYLKRAAHFLGAGAPADWTGVEMMSGK